MIGLLITVIVLAIQLHNCRKSNNNKKDCDDKTNCDDCQICATNDRLSAKICCFKDQGTPHIDGTTGDASCVK
jgi:hypothetical protein